MFNFNGEIRPRVKKHLDSRFPCQSQIWLIFWDNGVFQLSAVVIEIEIALNINLQLKRTNSLRIPPPQKKSPGRLFAHCLKTPEKS